MSEFTLDFLAFGAHPDDVEICCGGLLIKMAALGYKTGVVDLTRAEMSTRGDVKTRKKETDSATKILGLTVRENLELPDCHLSASGASDASNLQLNAVIAAIRKHRPRIIVAPFWQERHPDHVAASNLVTRAVFLAGLRQFEPKLGNFFNTLQLIYFPMRYEPRPSFVLDISDVVSKKIDSIKAYNSQVGPVTDNSPQTLLTSPLMHSTIDARDRYFGAMIGVNHGEPYVVKNVIGLNDPLPIFTAFSGKNALVYPEEIA